MVDPKMACAQSRLPNTTVIIQVLRPLFSRFHNDSHLLSLPFFLRFFLRHMLMGREKNNKMCIWTRRTTRNAMLVGFRTRVSIPGHLLPVPLLYDFCVDQVGTTIQLSRKVVQGNPIHIGVPLRTDQRVQHHLHRRRRTLSRLEAATWQTCGHNGNRTRVRVKTTNSTIPGLAPG